MTPVISDAAKVAEFWSNGFPDAIAMLEKNVAGKTFFGKSDALAYTDVSIYYLFFVLATENKDATDPDKALVAPPQDRSARDRQGQEKIV